MLSKKKIVNILSSLIFLFFYIINYNNYVGSKFFFLIYQFISFILFLVILNKKNSAFEFFIYFFFLLSFWFKFNCILYFKNIKIIEGDFDLNITNYDKATLVIIVVFISCIISSFLKKYLYNITENYKPNFKQSFKKFYLQKKKLIILFSLLLMISLWISNIYYKIYFKGLVNENILPLIKYFYSWLFTYGFSIFVSLLIYIDYLFFKKNKIFIIAIIEGIFTQLTILSRSFLLLIIAYYRGFNFLTKYNITEYILSKYNFIKIIIVFLLIFFLSIFFVDNFRTKNFNKIYETPKLTISKTYNEITFLLIYRWVGIDALLSVSQSNNLNFKLFLSSFNEKIKVKEKSFYIENFFKDFKYDINEKDNLNRVITPGIVAFLYYSGSLSIVFFGMILLILVCIFIEKLFFVFSINNIVLTNIIGYILASRVAHFGYVPINTLNFIFSLIITLLIIYYVMKFITKKRNCRIINYD
jgi:hypothetical protein